MAQKLILEVGHGNAPVGKADLEKFNLLTYSNSRQFGIDLYHAMLNLQAGHKIPLPKNGVKGNVQAEADMVRAIRARVKYITTKKTENLGKPGNWSLVDAGDKFELFPTRV